MTALVEVSDLTVDFRSGRLGGRTVRAVAGVSLSIPRGTTLGLVGESGCGKTTLGRAILQLVKPSSGAVHLDGIDVTAAGRRELRGLRKRMQMVFQDPLSSLDPRKTIGALLSEPLRVHGLAASQRAALPRVQELLDLVELPAAAVHQYPHEFSGGQRQRIGIARAIIIEPDLVVADEPVSSLDVSVEAQIVNLLESLQRTLGLSYLFISHDLAIVRHISDAVAVMYLGKIVEQAGVEELFARPRHPYTMSLLAAIPALDPSAGPGPLLLRGDLPSPADPPGGCRFHTRCPYRQPARCADEVPALRATGGSHQVACHFAEQIASGTLQPATAG
jgi:peptide/nickel transport system ATP-binding protein